MACRNNILYQTLETYKTLLSRYINSWFWSFCGTSEKWLLDTASFLSIMSHSFFDEGDFWEKFEGCKSKSLCQANKTTAFSLFMRLVDDDKNTILPACPLRDRKKNGETAQIKRPKRTRQKQQQSRGERMRKVGRGRQREPERGKINGERMM